MSKRNFACCMFLVLHTLRYSKAEFGKLSYRVLYRLQQMMIGRAYIAQHTTKVLQLHLKTTASSPCQHGLVATTLDHRLNLR